MAGAIMGDRLLPDILISISLGSDLMMSITPCDNPIEKGDTTDHVDISRIQQQILQSRIPPTRTADYSPGPIPLQLRVMA